MRNLKRALSLAMASIMLLGMMVVGTSAKGLDDFKDASEVVNKDAVAVTSAIGIFDGYEDGEFKPENVVTRAEMAVIISKILYGGNVNVDQFKDQKLFTDVPDWAEGYVNLCASLGIVAGYGDGKFGPSDTVTTAQAAMMLTKALGYFQNAKDYGDNWILAATAKATGLGIYGDLKLSATAGLNRDNVAEMVFNTLTKAVTVEYNDTFAMYYTTGADWTAGVKFNYRETLGYKNFDLVYESDDKDDFGRPCTVWGTGSLKTGDIDADGDIKSGYDGIAASDEIISAPNDADAVYTGKITSKTLYNALGSTAAKEYSWTIYVDGEEPVDADKIQASVLNNKSENDAEFSAKAGEDTLTGNGVLTQVFVDTDEKTVDIVVINTYVAEVLKVEDDYITLSALSGDAKIDDEFETTLFDEDDIVLYTYADGDIQSVVAADKLQGEVTRVRLNTSNGDPNTGDNFVVDGTTYKYTFATGLASTKLTAKNVDNDVVAYLDPYGYVIYIDYSASSYDYAYVLSVGSDNEKYDDSKTNSTAYARLILTDGTMVKAELDNKHAEASNMKGCLVSYTVDKDGVYTLDNATAKAVAPSLTKGASIVENGKASLKGILNTAYTANSDTTFVVVDSDDDLDDYEISVYTGIKNVPDIDMADKTIATVATKDNSKVAEVVYIQDGDISGSGDVIFALANSAAKLQKDSENGSYYEIDAVVDGAKVTLNVKSTSTAAQKLVKDIDTYFNTDNSVAITGTKSVVALKSYNENSDGFVTSVTQYTKFNNEDGALVAIGTLKAEDETVGLADTRYAYDDGVVVARYTTDDKAIKISRISAVKNDDNDKVLAVMDDNVVTGLFIVEVEGDKVVETITKADGTVEVALTNDDGLALTLSDAKVGSKDASSWNGKNVKIVTTLTVDSDEYSKTVTVKDLSAMSDILAAAKLPNVQIASGHKYQAKVVITFDGENNDSYTLTGESAVIYG